MKFETLKDAQSFAWYQTYYTKIKHKTIKTQYWSNDKEQYVKCYTVQMIFNK